MAVRGGTQVNDERGVAAARTRTNISRFPRDTDGFHHTLGDAVSVQRVPTSLRPLGRRDRSSNATKQPPPIWIRKLVPESFSGLGLSTVAPASSDASATTRAMEGTTAGTVATLPDLDACVLVDARDAASVLGRQRSLIPPPQVASVRRLLAYGSPIRRRAWSRLFSRAVSCVGVLG